MANKCSSTKALCVFIFISLLFSGVCGVHGDHEVHWVTKSQTQLNDFHFHSIHYIMHYHLLFFFFLQGSLREVISKLVSRMVILPLVILLPTFFGLVYLLVGHPCYLVTKLCPTLYYPMNCSLPGSSVRGISQARILEWVAISSSRGSSPPRDPTHISCVSCIGRWILYC